MFRKAIVALLALAVPMTAVAKPSVRSGTGETIAIPGATAIDHAGFTVPDLEQAVAFFVEVLGAAIVWRVAPVSGPGAAETMRLGLNADPRASASIAMLRLGPNLNVELIAYDFPGVTQTMPLNSALGVGHIAFDVEDIDAAGAYLVSKNVRMLQGPRKKRVARMPDRTAGSS